MKRKIFSLSNILTFISILCVLFVLVVSVKGTMSDLTPENIFENLRDETMPFELSPERGRFALLTSVVDNHSVYFSKEIARYVMPDLGFYNGKYVSLFPPGVSFFAIPFYLIGKAVGYPQYFAFLTSAFFAFLNFLLIFRIVSKLTESRNIGVIAGVAFLFGTTAFSYSTTLYQHHFISFFLLAGIYLIFYDSLLSLILSFLIVGFMFFVEYQSVLFYLPILVMLFLKNIRIRENLDKLTFSINSKLFVGMLFLLLSFIPFLYYNKITYGKYFQLAGTVQGTKNAIQDPVSGELILPSVSQKKSVSGFFHLYRLPKSMSVLLTSKDRGVLYFSPIVIFSIFGIIGLWNKKRDVALATVSSAVIIFTLYGMWGDPWGGWAFGTRYLIPAFVILSIPLGVAIKTYGRKWYFLFPFLAIIIFSIFVNISGGLTTNQIPPSVEQDASRYPAFTFIHNVELALSGKTSSFVYKTFLNNFDFRIFFFSIVTTIILIVLINYLVFILEHNKRK